MRWLRVRELTFPKLGMYSGGRKEPQLVRAIMEVNATKLRVRRKLQSILAARFWRERRDLTTGILSLTKKIAIEVKVPYTTAW